MEKVKGFLLLKVATHAYNNIWKHLMYTASSDIHILKSSFVLSIASLLYFLSHHSEHHRCCTLISWAIWWWLRWAPWINQPLFFTKGISIVAKKLSFYYESVPLTEHSVGMPPEHRRSTEHSISSTEHSVEMPPEHRRSTEHSISSTEHGVEMPPEHRRST